MKIATIVPEPHLMLTTDDDYHMALAQVARTSRSYLEFYARAVDAGKFVILDNGAAEGGSLSVADLRAVADDIQPTELVLPDVVGDCRATLEHSVRALDELGGESWRLMAVPQGKIFSEYSLCMQEMLTWPEVNTIGVSKFAARSESTSRPQFLNWLDDLLQSDKDIHLLGCVNDAQEAWRVEQRFPGRIRGIDSGIAAIATRQRKRLSMLVRRPKGELNFREKLYWPLLIENVVYWRKLAATGGLDGLS